MEDLFFDHGLQHSRLLVRDGAVGPEDSPQDSLASIGRALCALDARLRDSECVGDGLG